MISQQKKSHWINVCNETKKNCIATFLIEAIEYNRILFDMERIYEYTKQIQIKIQWYGILTKIKIFDKTYMLEGDKTHTVGDVNWFNL